MRILITADTVGGVWTYTRELVTALVHRGTEVTLVSFGGLPTEQQKEWMAALPKLNYRPSAFKLEWMQDSGADLDASVEYLQTVIHESRPDILHFNQFSYGALECDLPRIVVAHSDVMSWTMEVQGQEPPDSPWMRGYRSVVKRGLEAATEVVAPSHWMLRQISRYYTKRPIGKVIYNGRTPELFNPHLSKEDLIVTVGRLWDQGKNAALLWQRDMPAPVCVVGSDQHPESHGRAFGQGKVSDPVRFVGQQDECHLSRLLANAAIYAATSCYEPFGLAPVEAAFSRCAIVASDIPSFRELWDGAAIFFRNKDADSLAHTLELLMDEPGLHRSYGNLALHRARERFSAGRMVDEYLDLYSSLAGGRASAA